LAKSGVNGLRTYLKQTQAELDEIVSLVRQTQPGLTRMTLGSLIVIDVHAKYTLETLIKEEISSVQDFKWISQLRYYYQTDERNV
jgi:dynein heavy chain